DITRDKRRTASLGHNWADLHHERHQPHGARAIIYRDELYESGGPARPSRKPTLFVGK
ncbi:hypothetical protein J6590_092751, partial [Homalodisca vitripennis]